MSLSVDELLQTLKKSRLLSEKQQASVEDSVRNAQSGQKTAKRITPEAITKQLVKQKALTAWQAKMLLQKQSSFHLGQYRLLRAIGKGGMGKVFQAWDRKNKCDVAIKVLSGKLAKKPKLVARFQREVEVASKIDSPHIVRSFDAGQIGQSYFMVMEYVDGESVDEVADRTGRLQPGHACEIARQAALGLTFAHAQGMVHRDIKPANMMVSFEEGQPVVRLLDMGLARFEKADNDGMTRAGQVMGTPDYMAPEQGWNTADVDIRADIYSLGCTLFRLVTGQVPFPGDNPLQVLMARCSVDAPLASSLVEDLDPRVDAVIRRMTWRDPSQRYQTPQEVFDALTPLSVLPTKPDLEKRSQASVSDQPTVAFESTTTQQQEPSFQGFLREVDSGAEVRLMVPGQEGLGSTKGGFTQTGVQTPAATNQPAKRWPLFAAIGLIVGLLVLGALILFPRGSAGPPVVTRSPPPPPAVKITYFADLPIQRAEAGQAIGFFVAPEVTTGLDEVTYALGENAPEGATLDPQTGEFFWLPPRTQESGRVELTVLARRGEKTEANKRVLIDIRAAALDAKIVEFENTGVNAEEEWKYQLQLFGTDTIPPDAMFRLAGNPPDGLVLNADTGELVWTPKASQAGRVPIGIQLVDRSNDRVVHNAACSVLVRPAAPVQSIRLPVKMAQVGEELVVPLRIRTGTAIPSNVTLRLAAQTRVLGATIGSEKREFVWTPKKIHVGTHTMEVQAVRRNRLAARIQF